jgi:hypothetical protein
VKHLTPPRSFYVGEETSARTSSATTSCPSEKLGTTRAPIVLADRGGSVAVVIPQRATGTIELRRPTEDHRAAGDRRQGKTQACAELSGALTDLAARGLEGEDRA